MCIGPHDKRCKHDTSDMEEETESQILLRLMVKRQLSTSITLKEQFERQKCFTAGETHVPLTAAGTSTLADFVTADSRKRKVEELRSCGLTDEDVDLYMKHTGFIKGSRTRTLMEPSALKERIEAIQQRLEQRTAHKDEAGTDAETSEKSYTAVAERTGLPKDPMSHIMEFSKLMMERVNARKKKCHRNKERKDNESREVDAAKLPPDPMRLHTVVPLPDDEISANSLSCDEIRRLPQFQHYDPGVKNNVLYLKNLHPKVDIRELMALFLRFDEDDNVVKYRLLSGRFRGQAFVTFPNAHSAERAMALCNGYLLRGRPIVIEYGKKQTNQTLLN